jgi:hypothetical protein
MIPVGLAILRWAGNAPRGPHEGGMVMPGQGEKLKVDFLIAVCENTAKSELPYQTRPMVGGRASRYTSDFISTV